MDVYRIAVRIGMTSNAPQFLTALSSQLLGVDRQVGRVTSGFGKLHQVLAGALSVFAGDGLINGLERVAEHGKDLLDQQDKLHAKAAPFWGPP